MWGLCHQGRSFSSCRRPPHSDREDAQDSLSPFPILALGHSHLLHLCESGPSCQVGMIRLLPPPPHTGLTAVLEKTHVLIKHLAIFAKHCASWEQLVIRHGLLASCTSGLGGTAEGRGLLGTPRRCVRAETGLSEN